MLGTVAGLRPGQWLPLLFVATPLSLLWGAALLHAGRRALREARDSDDARGGWPDGAAALDGLTWLVLLLLTGWFGAVAYGAVHLSPRLLPRPARDPGGPAPRSVPQNMGAP